MIKYTIDTIEQLIQESKNISEERRITLLGLITQLREELEILPDSQEEDASSLAGFTEMSTREHLRNSPNDELKEISLQGARNALDAFKVSHPKLVDLLNRFLTSLSNLGI